VAQVRTGTIEGAVVDEQGALMPGVTVTLSGARVLGAPTAVTLQDGTYRFRGLEPGTYDLRFELSGFATLNREGIIIAATRTVTVDVAMSVAGVAETVTVTGESPLIDVKQTSIGVAFDRQELVEVPSSTDAWALLGQSPGVRMRGFDIGGSHKSQQSGYETFGIRDQNQVVLEGVITTEGEGSMTFYYDYYANEEVTISGSGADVEMQSPGAAVVFNVKSGGNTPSALVHFDYENENIQAENLDEESRAQGFTGNPVLSFYEVHADYGGPISKDKAWIYGAYNRFKVDAQISGVDPALATDLAILYQYTGKFTWAATQKDKFIAYGVAHLKLKPNRGLSATVPPESVLAQDNWSYASKGEWQRVWNNNTFTNVVVGVLLDRWPMVPKVDPHESPPRIEVATDQQSGAGWRPFTGNRTNPHITINNSYYVPDAAGSHDFKFGYLWRLDNSMFGYNASSGPIRYSDRAGNPFEVELVDVPFEGEFPSDRNETNAFWLQDTWSPSDRLTINAGFRFSRQKAYYEDTPKGNQALDSTEWFPFLSGTFSKETVPGQTVYTTNDVAPRLGVTFDLTGQGKTILKASYGRYYTNIADSLSGANPGGLNSAFFEFTDLDGDRVLSRPDELVREIRRSGGASTVIDPNTPLPFSDEVQLTLEHQFPGLAAGRIMYVHKTYESLGLAGPAVNLAQAPFLTVPFDIADPGDPTNTLHLWTTPAGVFGSDNLITEFPDSNSWNYDTLVFAFEKRLTANFYVQGSLDYQWREEGRRADNRSTSPLTADPIGTGWYQNHSRDVSTLQDSTNWGFKTLARYQFPQEIAIATNLRMQSGWPYARVVSLPIYAGTGVNVAGARSLGTRSVFVEDIQSNRSETVPLWDIRVDKTWSLGDWGSFMLMADVYNLLNSNAVTNFRITTGDFGSIIAALSPRILKIGARWTF
jgi:hypothetical protein